MRIVSPEQVIRFADLFSAMGTDEAEEIVTCDGQVAEAVVVDGELTAVALRVHSSCCAPNCECDPKPKSDTP
jgi:hypothetical protein